MAASKQLRRWTFTFFPDTDTQELQDYNSYCEKFVEFIKDDDRILHWICQLEKTPLTGKYHIQGRISFKSGKRMSEVKAILGQKAHVSQEHDEEASSFYCMKKETRISGPWSDKDEKSRIDPIPLYKEEGFALKVWQAFVVEELKKQLADPINRMIMCVYEPNGNVGKTFLVDYIRSHMNCVWIPPILENGKQIVEYAHSHLPGKHWRGVVIVDLPRSVPKNTWSKLAPAIECMKNGDFFESRYKGSSIHLTQRPAVLVVCNEKPDVKHLSNDRWHFVNPSN